jgi:hypothetical protein
VARRATAIDSARVRDPELVLLCAGDFYGTPGIIELYRSRFLARMMVDMGYTAVALGERELNHGLRAIRENIDDGLPVICANIMHGGERILPPSIVTERSGVKVGVFALLGEEPREGEEFEITDPVAAGRETIEKLERDGCELIILLAHMRSESLRDLLPRLDGVDIVVRGHAAAVQNAADDCADTTGGTYENLGIPVLFAGDRGRAIGMVRVDLSRSGEPVLAERRLINLDATIPEDLETAMALKEFTAEEGARRRELRMSEFLARDEITGRIKERFLGIETCRRCHADLMPRFVMSRHFRAFETLEMSGDTRNPECLGCHTTGYGLFSGYDPETHEKGAVNLQGVQCEECHGPGTMHSRDGAYVASARQSCRRCHTPHWSPDFDFETYWARANHCTPADADPADER